MHERDQKRTASERDSHYTDPSSLALFGWARERLLVKSQRNSTSPDVLLLRASADWRDFFAVIKGEGNKRRPNL
jgi:hypothetical protein